MIYADYNGSTPLQKQVLEFLKKRLDQQFFANPNSNHRLGRELLKRIEQTRRECAHHLGAQEDQVYFNSGSTEGIAHAFYSVLEKNDPNDKNVIVISAIEHSAVTNTAHSYARLRGYKVLTLPVDTNGVISEKNLREVLSNQSKNIALVAVMAANNETGAIQPYQEIAELCQQHLVPYICDTTQLIGKASFDFQSSGIDYAFVSSHKIGAMIGTGIILAKEPKKLMPMIQGGGQEKNIRSGTQNYLAIETLGIAIKECVTQQNKLEKLALKRNWFEQELQKQFPEIVIFAQNAPRVAGTSLLSHPDILGNLLQLELEQRDVFVSTSSACSDSSTSSSKVLMAMGVPDHLARGAIRIGLGCCHNGEEFDELFELISQTLKKLLNLKNQAKLQA